MRDWRNLFVSCVACCCVILTGMRFVYPTPNKALFLSFGGKGLGRRSSNFALKVSEPGLHMLPQRNPTWTMFCSKRAAKGSMIEGRGRLFASSFFSVTPSVSFCMSGSDKSEFLSAWVGAFRVISVLCGRSCALVELMPFLWKFCVCSACLLC